MGAKYGVFVFLLLIHVNCEIYTSIQKLTALAEMESKLFVDFENFLRQSEAQGAVIPESMTRFYHERKNDTLLDNCSNMANPIRAFYLIHRVYNDWGDVLNTISSNQTIATQPSVADFRALYRLAMTKLRFWPVRNDVDGSADNILRLWSTYGFDTTDILNGKIASISTRRMKSVEIEALSNTAGLIPLPYYQLILLCELSNRTHDETERDRYRRKISKIYYWTITKKIPILRAPTLAYTDIPKLSQHNKVLRKASKTTISQEDINELLEPPSVFEKLCRGPLKTKKEESLMRCFLRETAVPFYLAKEEVVNIEPRVSLFHDVISDHDITYLKREATKKLSQSLTSDGVNRIRVSQTGWIRDSAHPRISRRLSKRIANIVNLDTTYRNRASPVEEWQVLSYTTGGHYGEHIDPVHTEELLWEMTEKKQKHLPLPNRYQGQRIATWMFYLSDVDSGGATVFPKLKVRVPVVKRAAAFWYNISPNGEIDHRMVHGGCPVIIGSKWVCNKWIRQSGQVLKRLCGQTYESEDLYPEKYMP